eukprot:Pompholyxophrys_sp_v1_NODE_63_length_2609_cov_168.302271.p2 type:complete len:132 gc:universal NODE_63_length_2609_cov_168.302271:1287-892(-)
MNRKTPKQVVKPTRQIIVETSEIEKDEEELLKLREELNRTRMELEKLKEETTDKSQHVVHKDPDSNKNIHLDIELEDTISDEEAPKGVINFKPEYVLVRTFSFHELYLQLFLETISRLPHCPNEGQFSPFI